MDLKNSWLLLKFFFQRFETLNSGTFHVLHVPPQWSGIVTVEVLKSGGRNLIPLAAFIYSLNHVFTNSSHKHLTREGSRYSEKHIWEKMPSSSHFHRTYPTPLCGSTLPSVSTLVVVYLCFPLLEFLFFSTFVPLWLRTRIHKLKQMFTEVQIIYACYEEYSYE